MRLQLTERRRWQLAGAALAVVLLATVGTLVATQRATGEPGDLRFTIDPTLTPAVTELPGVGDDDPSRPVASLVDDGTQVDFVVGELLVSLGDAGVLADLVDRWGGEVVLTVDPAVAGIDADPFHLVRFDPASADPAGLVADLRALAPHGEGTFQVSSEGGLATLAAVSREAAQGVAVTANWLALGQGIAHGFTIEAPDTDDNCRDHPYTPNAFDWPYLDRGGAQDIGVADAWRALEAAGQLDNKVTFAVVDGGFSANADFPAGADVPTATRNQWPCGGGGDCPWHGTDVVMAGAGVPDNGWGAAGPAGPVATQVRARRSPEPSVTGMIAGIVDMIAAVASSGGWIINISAGFKVPSPLNNATDLVTEPFFAGLATAGNLVFASAGNDGADVDATRGRGIFTHEKHSYYPCESIGVTCVGGLDWDSQATHSGSNYGSADSGGSVDIFAPYEVWVGPNPDNYQAQGGLPNIARIVCGTSFSSPFAAGVAALVWAADPGLSAGEVGDILFETAHTHSNDARVPRWVNAIRAVERVLGPLPPTVRITSSPGDRHLGRPVRLQARAHDLATGAPCCTVTWQSDRDGELGTGQGFFHELAHTFTTPGRRVITATARRADGATATARFTLTVVNSPPEVRVTGPAGPVHRGVPTLLRATAADLNEPNRLLECDRLRWTSSVPADPFPVTGCMVEVVFDSDGPRTLTVTATDPQGATGTARLEVTVVAPPENLPPVVRITSPEDGAAISHLGSIELSGTATDPEDDAPLAYEWSVTWTRRGETTGPVVIGDTANLSWRPSDTIEIGSGRYTIRLRLVVTDPAGNRGSDEVVVTMDGPLD